MAQEEVRRPLVSVVVPALDEAASIEATLAALLRLPGRAEVIVVDGGSTDDTVRLATRAGARVIDAPRGRGSQMHAGALAAAGDVLWFLHADTLPPPDALARIADELRDGRAVGGNFEIRFGGDFGSARFLTRLYRHLARFGLRYGDSAYFVRRDAYLAAGGFRPLPIFEDLDLLRRLLKRGRFVRAAATVVTSSRRFEGRWFALVFARWAFLQVLYWFGVSPELLGRMYKHIRVPGSRRGDVRGASGEPCRETDGRRTSGNCPGG